jgi:hypothetical protein
MKNEKLLDGPSQMSAANAATTKEWIASFLIDLATDVTSAVSLNFTVRCFVSVVEAFLRRCART